MVPQRLLHESLLRSAETCPGKPAVVTPGSAVAYGDLADRALRLGRALQDRGLRRGDRVAVYMDNTPECAAAIFGTLCAGGVFLAVNPQTKEEKLAYILSDSEASFIVTQGGLARTATASAAVVPSVKAVLDPLDETIAAAEPCPRDAGTIPLDLAALIYTSGSTGRPKGVMMTHQSMVFAEASVAQYLRLGAEDRILNVLPLAFDYGLYQLLMSVRLGATLVLERGFAFPAQIVRRVEEEAVTVFPGVPTVFATLLALHERRPLRLPTVTRITNTAAALPESFHSRLREVFPNALVFRMYGLTECKRVSYLEPELIDSKPGSVGKAIPGTEAIVLDPEGRPVAPGEAGILHVRGPHVMAGYWRRPDLSAHMLKEGPVPGERVLCTHDRFTVDEDGFLYFVGRSDDIIKTRGEKVSPIEVENALYALGGVREAAVVGIPDPLLGEAIRAYVVAEGLGEREIIAACHARLESFMVPRDVVFVDELPKTESGKIAKARLDSNLTRPGRKSDVIGRPSPGSLDGPGGRKRRVRLGVGRGG